MLNIYDLTSCSGGGGYDLPTVWDKNSQTIKILWCTDNHCISTDILYIYIFLRCLWEISHTGF